MAITSRQFLAALALLAAQASAWADGPIYLCVDASGHKELTDTNKGGCRLLDLPGAIPAPKARAALPVRARGPSLQTPSPSDFPRVDAREQRARDDDRRDILAEELQAEMKRLADLRAEYKNGEPDRLGSERNYAKYQERVAHLRDNIARSEKNIEALRREIGNLR